MILSVASGRPIADAESGGPVLADVQPEAAKPVHTPKKGTKRERSTARKTTEARKSKKTKAENVGPEDMPRRVSVDDGMIPDGSVASEDEAPEEMSHAAAQEQANQQAKQESDEQKLAKKARRSRNKTLQGRLL